MCYIYIYYFPCSTTEYCIMWDECGFFLLLSVSDLGNGKYYILLLFVWLAYYYRYTTVIVLLCRRLLLLLLLVLALLLGFIWYISIYTTVCDDQISIARDCPDRYYPSRRTYVESRWTYSSPTTKPWCWWHNNREDGIVYYVCVVLIYYTMRRRYHCFSRYCGIIMYIVYTCITWSLVIVII